MASIENASEFTLPDKYHANRQGPVRWIISHAKHQWVLIFFAFLAALINAGFASISAVLIGNAFNAILSTPPRLDLLLTIAIQVGILQVSRSIIQFGRNFSFEVVAQRIERDVRDELYTSLLGKSMTFHNIQVVGETMARATNDVREINYTFSPGVNLVIGSAIFLVMPIVVAPTYHYALILTPILFVIFYVLALWDYLNRLRPLTDEVRESFGNLNSRLSEVLDGIEVVKGFVQEKAEIGLFRQNANRYRNAAVEQAKIESRFLPLLLMTLATAGGLLHAIFLYRVGILNIGQVVGYFGLLMLLDFPTFTSIFAYSMISSGISSAKRILELILAENNLDQNLSGYTGPMRGRLEFRDVSFSHEGDENAIEGISFIVEPGQTVAIVGQTGSGKTTLMRLINRIFDVTSGQVLIDGVNVRDWNLESLRRNISIIEQDVFLFSRTIHENITFGCPGADMIEIERVAKAAQVDEFVSQLKEGFDTVVGERGVMLSGGQRQRIALARAFLTDPRILILDDSTSAIDSDTEDRIQKAIFAASRGRTTLIITHRLSQIRWANLIIVLRKGRVTAMGNHEELMATSEAYKRIFVR
jgi:ATP-binding cassette, subfamily B, bacterial